MPAPDSATEEDELDDLSSAGSVFFQIGKTAAQYCKNSTEPDNAFNFLVHLFFLLTNTTRPHTTTKAGMM